MCNFFFSKTTLKHTTVTVLISLKTKLQNLNTLKEKISKYTFARYYNVIGKFLFKRGR